VQHDSRGVHHPAEQRAPDGESPVPGRFGLTGGDRFAGGIDQERWRQADVDQRSGQGVDRRGRHRPIIAGHRPAMWISHAGTLLCVVVALLLLVLVPLIELYVLVQVASAIGVWNAIGLLLLISIIGAWIVKRQGVAMWRRAQLQITAGSVPTKEMADGVLLLLAGILLLVPGYVTSAIGVLLLLPPVRALVRGVLVHRWVGKVTVIRATYRGPIDTTATDGARDVPPGRPELDAP